MLKIAIMGAGGLGREILDFIDASRQFGRDVEAVGFIDDDRSRWGQLVNDRPILGDLDWFFEKPGRLEVRVLCGAGDPYIRRQMARTAARRGLQFCNLFHPTSWVSRYATVGIGVVTGHCVMIESQAYIGDHVVINTMAGIGHDVTIGSYSYIAPGALITGGIQIGEGVFVGINSTGRFGVRVGDGAVVGAMAMLTKDIPEDATAVGVPARVVSIRRPGWKETVDMDLKRPGEYE